MSIYGSHGYLPTLGASASLLWGLPQTASSIYDGPSAIVQSKRRMWSQLVKLILKKKKKKYQRKPINAICSSEAFLNPMPLPHFLSEQWCKEYLLKDCRTMLRLVLTDMISVQTIVMQQCVNQNQSSGRWLWNHWAKKILQHNSCFTARDRQKFLNIPQLFFYFCKVKWINYVCQMNEAQYHLSSVWALECFWLLPYFLMPLPFIQASYHRWDFTNSCPPSFKSGIM